MSVSANNTRDISINIRAKRNQKELIDRAAEIQGKSRSEFMLDSACQRAWDVILDRAFFGLEEEKFQEFWALLDAPAKRNEKLNALLTTPAPWD